MNEDLRTLNTLRLEDEALVKKLVKVFREQIPEFLMNFDKCMNAGDFKELKNQAHAFKGVCLNLGFNSLGQELLLLQEASLTEERSACLYQLSQVRQACKDLEETLQEGGY